MVSGVTISMSSMPMRWSRLWPGIVVQIRCPLANADALADVGGQVLVAALVVADGHAPAAAAADDDALQQCRSFPGRSGDAVTAVGGGVGGQAVAVGVEPALWGSRTWSRVLTWASTRLAGIR